MIMKDQNKEEEYKTPPRGGPSIKPRPSHKTVDISSTLTVTVPILEPNSPATIANDAVSAAAPPIAITTRRRKQKTTKTTPLVAVDIKLTKTPISGATTNTTRGYIPKMRPISVPEAFISCA
ncbi:hypothetical protein pdam_00010716 [Pocillopora damicornis]|uniref:Uncharacterized protein n=1 Tax=Pocillopora damicornis TaxID=46731 RepID=A0A3M6UJV3_POCDA|nr:hypothetical protein pdam_00010716 [Pocillopora damicornis]